MRHVHSLEEVTPDRPSFVTIGAFDGVHLGHQRVIGMMTEAAHAAGCASVVVTFHPHPAVVLRGRRTSYYINTPGERADLIGALGVDWVVTHPFTVEISRITAAEFVGRLSSRLRMVELWAGQDFALGHNREGNVAYLRRQGEAKGFRVRVVEARTGPGSPAIISSSGIRSALEAGSVELVTEYLGRPFSLAGRVVKGAGRGKTIGIPTANLAVGEERAYPAHGVYACWASIGGGRWPAVTNIGVRPTFEQTKVPTIEAHLLDFGGDLYGKDLALAFVARLRPEKKFNGVDALVAQIKADIEQARRILNAESLIPNP